MSYLKRRLEKMEKKLNIGNERTGVLIVLVDERHANELPEPIEEWVTYKGAKSQRSGDVRIVQLDLTAELKAREMLQKVT